MNKKQLADLIDALLPRGRQQGDGPPRRPLRTLGFAYATKAGISICIDDMVIPATKDVLLDEAHEGSRRDRGAVQRRSDHRRRALQQGRRHLGAASPSAIAEEMMNEIGNETSHGPGDRRRVRRRRRSTRSSSWPTPAPVARPQQIRQLAGMRGLMAKPSGEIIETPDHGELPRRSLGAPVLHLDARRS